RRASATSSVRASGARRGTRSSARRMRRAATSPRRAGTSRPRGSSSRRGGGGRGATRRGRAPAAVPAARPRAPRTSGPPRRRAQPAGDAEFGVELGEALLAKGDPKAAAARLAPIAPALPEHAAIRVVLGAAQLGAGEAELAVATLGEAERIASAPRSRKLLG